MAKKSDKVRLKLGDTVFYPGAGVGTVSAIESVSFGDRPEPCYVIVIEDSHMRVKVPRSRIQEAGVRPLVHARNLQDLYKILSSRPRRRVTGGNWTERCKEIERRIHNGTCLELGEVVRDLMRWKQQTGLSFEESMLLDTASTYLVREVSAVSRAAPDEVRERIRSHIEARAA